MGVEEPLGVELPLGVKLPLGVELSLGVNGPLGLEEDELDSIGLGRTREALSWTTTENSISYKKIQE